MSSPVSLGNTVLGNTAIEQAIRQRLGIPVDAERVLVFCESSHWDTNWLETSEEYFKRRLEPIFTAVVRALERDPGRIYCVESVFFLRLFWERHPEYQDRLRTLVARRQLRIVSSSFTTPDTLLPHPEAIVRDFHLGQDWLTSQGLAATPRTAYFPDNFGHSPHLPSLMHAVGVDSVALTRIDGMYFIASDYRPFGDFPLKGSTAEKLQKELKTLDFVWRADDGTEILSHWNAFTYFQGDMLAHLGIVRWNGHVIALPWRTRRHIARRIDGFVRQLAPLSRTPYLLCPIGMDFNDPISDLRPLIDRYNKERYQETGTWVVLAGLDDYFDLVGTRRADLPVLAVDPNPYWMGFYASRPALKARPTRIVRSLILAENASAFAPPNPALETVLRDGWSNVVLMNHHDAITGTSPDHIYDGEQTEWLVAAEAAASEALSLACGSALLPPMLETRNVEASETLGVHHGIRWWRANGEIRVHTNSYHLKLSEDRGGCLTSLVANGQELLKGPGLDLVAFSDHGGLWRLGHEFAGGRFAEVSRASENAAVVELREEGSGLTITISSRLRGAPFTRVLTCRGSDPFIELCVTGAAPRGYTVTCHSELALAADVLEMDTVGGSIERPSQRLHSPTFWPVPSLLSLRSESQALHACFEAPSAVSFSPSNDLEWIVARNARKERAFRFLPVLAHPIGGTSDVPHAHRAALFVSPPSVDTAEVRARMERYWQSHLQHFTDTVIEAIRCDDPAVAVVASKRADQGLGVIVRLSRENTAATTVRLSLPTGAVLYAMRCDGREQDIESLEVKDGCAVITLRHRLTSVRLIAG